MTESGDKQVTLTICYCVRCLEATLSVTCFSVLTHSCSILFIERRFVSKCESVASSKRNRTDSCGHTSQHFLSSQLCLSFSAHRQSRYLSNNARKRGLRKSRRRYLSTNRSQLFFAKHRNRSFDPKFIPGFFSLSNLHDRQNAIEHQYRLHGCLHPALRDEELVSVYLRYVLFPAVFHIAFAAVVSSASSELVWRDVAS